ncbi:MAG: DUF1580 domain-containing protein [Phycisphaeraceae bacterium]|nr:DUF1580 domain-containing protein [Phycisphaeraceae bacterium]MCW5764146.1 DUF1580 domain-containing protein [Phycisphaeraceae bacterium]
MFDEPSRTTNNDMPADAAGETKYLSLAEAAKFAPGRPTPNCVWRWCRKGVQTRGGERVRLKHARFGGKIFTTRVWLHSFAEALAERDAEYFSLDDERVLPRDLAHLREHETHDVAPPRSSPRSKGHLNRLSIAHEHAEAELKAAGI